MSGRLKIIDLLEAERRAVLFVDWDNSTCSQMADGFASYLAPSSVKIFSAGLTKGAVHPMTVTVMKESGIDIAKATAKDIASIDLDPIAVVVSLCDAESLSLPTHIKHLPIPLANPASQGGSELEIREVFRNARNQVRELVSTLL